MGWLHSLIDLFTGIIKNMEKHRLDRFLTIRPRLAATILIVCGTVAALVLVRQGAVNPVAIQSAIGGSKMAALSFVLMQIVASLTFIPRTVLGIAAGLLFGFAWGAFWAILGAEMGAAAAFALWRWIGGELDPAKSAAVARIVAQVEKGGWRAVAIVRLIPGLPHSLVNTALALTKVRWLDYLAGSLIGMLPMTLLQVDIGAAGGRMLQGQGAWVGGSLLLAAGLGGTFLLKRMASRRP